MTTATIVRHAEFRATPDELFDAFTVQELLTQWFAQHADLDVRDDGWWTFTWPPYMAARGRYITVDRPHHLVWTWDVSVQDTRVAPESGETHSSVTMDYTFTTLEDGRTRLDIIESGHDTDEIARMNADGIDQMLDQLRKFIEDDEHVDWTIQPD